MKVIKVGLVADPASPTQIARRMSDLDAPGGEDRDTWDIEVVSEPFTLGSESVDTAVARLQNQARRHGWDLVVGLTELPLRDDDGRYLLIVTDPRRRTAVLSLPAPRSGDLRILTATHEQSTGMIDTPSLPSASATSRPFVRRAQHEEARRVAAKFLNDDKVWQGEIAGSASAVLIGASRGAHMLVVGNRGFGAYGSAMLGSVSSAVARHAECPVTVVRGVVEDPARRRVVTVGVDYLQPDASTVRFAADQASRWGVPLRIVSAWAPPLLEAPSLGRSAAPEEDPWSNTRRSMASAAVSNAAKLARGIAPDLAIEVSTPESRAAPTLEEDSRRSSLVVLGSRHLQPQEAMAPSSVSCALLNHASCPVTIAPGEPLLVSRSTSRP